MVKFKEWDCEIERHEYGNGGTALVLVDLLSGERIATASVYIGKLPEGEIAIKDYAENEGMVEALVEAGVIEVPTRFVQSGFVSIPICRLVEKDPTPWCLACGARGEGDCHCGPIAAND